jgi:hypothetical protein
MVLHDSNTGGINYNSGDGIRDHGFKGCLICNGLVQGPGRSDRISGLIIESESFKHYNTREAKPPTGPWGCRGCRLLRDGIDALGIDLDSVKEILLGFSQGTNSYVRTVSLRIKFHDGQISDWYQLYCVGDQIPPRYSIQLLENITGNTACPRALEWIRERYENCRTTHTSAGCSSKIPTGNAPSRILDLRNPEQNLTPDSIVRLVETDGVAAQFTPYIALSYCWGLCKTLVTTKDNFAHHKTGVPLSSFGKTHQDAIILANALGYFYLWIDALCIIQGDQQDWKFEASNMQEVYKGADLTIAASAGIDSDSGLFTTSSADEIGYVVQSEACDSDQSPTTAVCIRKSQKHGDFFGLERFDGEPDLRSPLMKRGWVFQERLLSPRYLHFGRELVWECAESSACECGILQAAEEVHISRPKADLQNKLSTASPLAEVQNVWKQLVEQYSSLNLTYHDDRVLAIDGLAHHFESYGLGSYHAGHWEVGFANSLLWQSSQIELKPRPRAWSSRSWTLASKSVPSWSWAAIPGHIYMNEVADSDIVCKIITSPFDSTSSALESDKSLVRLLYRPHPLKLRGHMCRFAHHWEAPDESEKEWRKGFHWLSTGDQSSKFYAIPDFAWYSSYSGCNFDNSQVSNFVNQDEGVYCLLAAEEKSRTYALVLRCRNEKEQLYERIGVTIQFKSSGSSNPGKTIGKVIRSTRECEVTIL